MHALYSDLIDNFSAPNTPRVKHEKIISLYKIAATSPQKSARKRVRNKQVMK